MEEIPDEVLDCILDYLDYKNLNKCRLINQRFRFLATQELHWKRLAKIDFHADDCLWESWTYYEFYSLVLHRFRYCFGWFKRKLSPIGGLLYVKVESDGIVFYDCLPCPDARFLAGTDTYAGLEICQDSKDFHPDNDRGTGQILMSNVCGQYHQLRKCRLFTLSYLGKRLRPYCSQSLIAKKDNICHRTCSRCTTEFNHDCEVRCQEANVDFIQEDVKTSGFSLICQDDHSHSNVAQAYEYWLELEHGLRVSGRSALERLMEQLRSENYVIRAKKFAVLFSSAGSVRATPFCRAVLPIDSNHLYQCQRYSSNNGLSQNCSVCIKYRLPTDVCLPGAGIYTGTYSVHGLELIECHYEVTEKGQFVFVGRKITGDRNVPADQITFKADIQKRLLFERFQLETPQSLNEAYLEQEAGSFSLGFAEVDRFISQPFEVSDGNRVLNWKWDGETALDGRCRGRYLGLGQIAQVTFVNPSFSPAVLAVHSSQMFTLTWIELEHISAFYKLDTQPQCFL